MTIHNRRLRRDYEKVRSELAGSDFVTVHAVSGDPPDHYQLTYKLNGLAWDSSAGGTKPITEHVVDVYLPPAYPKQSPRCVMRTPIWHPNIGDYVCIGDYWSAGVTLVDVIAHIADMIQYRSYNLRSPLDKAAAQWAQRNASALPVGTRSIRPPESDQPAQVVVDLPAAPGELDISLGPMRERR